MRIVLISSEHPARPLGGGIGTYTKVMGSALARHGHEVTMLTRGAGGAYEEDGIEVVEIDHRWLPHAGVQRLLMTRKIAMAVDRARPDVVQAAEYEAEAWWIARRGAVPLVTRLATPTYLVEALNSGPDPGTRLVRRMERDQALRSHALVAPSHTIVHRLRRAWGLDPATVEVIPNPLDGAAIRRMAAADPLVPLPDRFLLFIGRLERRKGVETLADALPAVMDAHPGVHVVLIGRDAGEAGGNVMDRIRQRTTAVTDRVHVLGEHPRDQALAVVARAALVVLPSRWEAFGFVATEALALGRPVIASSGSGFSEIVEHDRSGWLVPPDNADALAAELIRRLGDPEGLARVACAGRKRAESFEADRLVPPLLAVYERLTAGTATRGGSFSSAIYTGGYRRFFRPEDRSGPFHALYERKRGAVLDHFGNGRPLRLVDVGCGPGRILAPLAASHDMTGCDVSSDMLDEARRRCPPEVRLIQADARRLPFDDAEFDGLIALDLLTHLPDLPAALHELSRVVAPGGELVLDSSNASPWWVLAYPAYVNWRPRRLVATMRRQGVLPEWSEIVRHHRAEEVREAIADAGLELIGLQRFGPPWAAKWHLWYAQKPV